MRADNSPRPREIHTSLLLHRLIASAPQETFTLDWFVGNLPRHSFGVILLFLAIVSIVPFVSIVAQLLISLLAIQIIVGYARPVLPQRLMLKPLPSRYLTRLDRLAIPALERLEQVVRPRWQRLLQYARRPTALIALILTLISLVAPIPMANLPPAMISVMMALAYIEHDGLLLFVALCVALALLAVVGVVLARHL